MKERLSFGFTWTGMGLTGIAIGLIGVAIKFSTVGLPLWPTSNIHPAILVLVMFLGVAAGTFAGLMIWALIGFGISIILYWPSVMLERWIDKVLPPGRKPVESSTPTP